MARKRGKPDGYGAHREAMAEASRERSRLGRDLGDIPGPLNQERRERGRLSFRAFCEEYFPVRFALEWSPDHLKVIELVETTVRNGGLFAMAMPRGAGKTSLVEAAAIWAIVYGLHRFVVLIGATDGHATEMLESVKTELDTNESLFEDFHEVCDPIREIEGKANRCKGQHQHGQRTFIRWGRSMVVLPRVKESQGAAESIIKVASILGRIRGMKYTASTGDVVRP